MKLLIRTGMYMDEYVGTDIGIYHVESICDYKATDGHKLYHVKCRYCAFESNMKLFDIKYPKVCKHKALTGRIIEFKSTWSNQRLAGIYYQMIQRCYDHNNRSYQWYGQNGVTVCEEWVNNPKSFEEWAVNNGYTDSLTIDRIDVNGNYEPNNCRWISLEENSRRSGKVNWITVGEKTLTGRQWAEKFGLGINTINTIMRKYGSDKTKELIAAMIQEPPSTKDHKANQSLFVVYGIQI